MEIQALDEIDKAVAELQEQVEVDLLALDNVVGVGVGRKIRAQCDTGEPCLTVFVSRKEPLEFLDVTEIPFDAIDRHIDWIGFSRSSAWGAAPSYCVDSRFQRSTSLKKRVLPTRQARRSG